MNRFGLRKNHNNSTNFSPSFIKFNSEDHVIAAVCNVLIDGEFQYFQLLEFNLGPNTISPFSAMELYISDTILQALLTQSAV